MKHIFSQDSITDWFSQHSADKEYRYDTRFECPFAQYLDAHGIRHQGVGSMYWNDEAGKAHAIPPAVANALLLEPWTFGALVERLR